MFCIDNNHLYRSAFFIPKWLCGAMDFINGSLRCSLHTARCNHYSNMRIASIMKHMHDQIEYAWVSHSAHKFTDQKYTCEWAWQDFACKVSINTEDYSFLKLKTCEALTQRKPPLLTLKNYSSTHINQLLRVLNWEMQRNATIPQN